MLFDHIHLCLFIGKLRNAKLGVLIFILISCFIVTCGFSDSITLYLYILNAQKCTYIHTYHVFDQGCMIYLMFYLKTVCNVKLYMMVLLLNSIIHTVVCLFLFVDFAGIFLLLIWIGPPWMCQCGGLEFEWFIVDIRIRWYSGKPLILNAFVF